MLPSYYQKEALTLFLFFLNQCNAFYYSVIFIKDLS